MTPRPLLLRRLRRCLCTATTPTPTPTRNPKPSTKTPTKAIKTIFKLQDPDALAAAFTAASDSYRFRCKHRIYEIAVRRLSASGRPDAIEQILEHQKRYLNHGSSPTEGFAVRLISLYGRARMPDHAVSTFHQLPSLLQSPRTVMSFNALLTVLSDSKSFPRLSDAFHDIPSTDPSIVPDLISYNIYIHALCRKGDPDAALDTLSLIEKNNIAPDLSTFNILLNGFYSKKRFSDAEKVWVEMRERKIEPDTKSFNAKMRGLVSDGRIVEAAELANEIKRIGLKPDTFTFNTLIKGYCQSGNLEEAKRVYSDLAENDCVPNKPTFEILIPYLYEAREVDLAVKICNASISRRCFVDAAVLQGVVDVLVKGSREKEAKKLVELGLANNYPKKRLRMPETVKIA